MRKHHVLWGSVEQMQESDDDSWNTGNNGMNAAVKKGMVFADDSDSSFTLLEDAGNLVPNSSIPVVGGATAEESLANWLATVELLKTANMWSHGSEMHGINSCRPCHYVHTAKGCKNGSACNFCHAPHTGSAHKRPSKEKRKHCRFLMKIAQESQVTLEPGLITRKSAFMQNLLQVEEQGSPATLKL